MESSDHCLPQSIPGTLIRRSKRIVERLLLDKGENCYVLIETVIITGGTHHGNAARKSLIDVMVVMVRQDKLFHVVGTCHSPCSFTGSLDGGQQKSD